MQYIYSLNEAEKDIIDYARRLSDEKKAQAEKRKTCQHDWKYDGHSHNDDCYVCGICGESEYR